MLTIIDRYIVKVFIGYFIAGLLIFAVIFLATDFMGAFSKYDVSTDILMRYYSYFLVEVVHQMIPVACLVGTVFTLSGLNKTHELIALFSLGYSLARVSAPILAVVSLISVFNFWLSDRILPSVAQKKKFVYYVEIKNKPGLYSTVKTDKIWYRSQNILFNIQTLDPVRRKAQGLSLYYFDSAWNLVQLIHAKNVNMEGERWNLKNGSVTLFTKESSFPLTKTFEQKTITMNEDIGDLQSTTSSADVMSVGQLRRFIKRNKEAGLDTLRYEVDYHSKFGFSLAAFVMSLIGIPFSVSLQRSGNRFMNLGICIGFAFLYWVMFSSSITLGRHEILPPLLAAWAPNILMGGLSVFFLLRLKK